MAYSAKLVQRIKMLDIQDLSKEVRHVRCPNCSNKESKVIDSRSFEDGSSIRRRRECLACGTRFTTYERCEKTPVMVKKRDQSIEPFDASKLLRSLLTATAKRDIPLETLEGLVESLENDIRYQYREPIPSSVLGNQVLIRLKDLDLVAYVRFASVYKDFKDLGEFVDELDKLTKSGQGSKSITSHEVNFHVKDNGEN